MKKHTNPSFLFFWLPICIALALFLAITFIGNILVIGSKLGTFNSTLEIFFYAILVIVFCWLIALPLVGVFSKPVLSLEDIASDNSGEDYKKLKKVAQELVNAGVLPAEEQGKLAVAIRMGSDIRGPMAEALNIQIESSNSIIRSHSVSVFVSTAVSQNGKLDAIAVLVANLRLVHSLVNNFGYRPPLQSLISIYVQIFLATFIADQLDDIKSENFFNKIGAGAISAIPGSGMIVNSLLDGGINALFTLRVGYLTKKYLLNAGKELVRSNVQKSANLESRKEIIPVVKEALPMLPNAIKKLLQTAL